MGLSRRRVLTPLAGESPVRTNPQLSLVCNLPGSSSLLSREHIVEQLSFLVVTQTTVVVAITEVSLAVVWRWTLLLRNRLIIRYLGIAGR
jgi:hypothetical protein